MDYISTLDKLQTFALTPGEIEYINTATSENDVLIPGYYAQLIDWKNPADPIRRQVVPDIREIRVFDRELTDPIGDEIHSPVPRLTHRYPDRVLLCPTYRCAVRCRFCFRKERINAEECGGFSEELLRDAFEYITDHTELNEIILSGGDPLTLDPAELEWIFDKAGSIPHIKKVRIHTRVPVVDPTRVTGMLTTILSRHTPVTIVTHFNHPNEITAESITCCRKLRTAGCLLLNQSVLLRDINDSPETLTKLFRKLIEGPGIIPYYLHHCDLTKGISHFRTTIRDGAALMRKLRGNLSGICIPEYVLDLPGGNGKIPLTPSYIVNDESEVWTFRSYRGTIHSYHEIVRE